MVHMNLVHPFDSPMRPALMLSHFTDEHVEGRHLLHVSGTVTAECEVTFRTGCSIPGRGSMGSSALSKSSGKGHLVTKWQAWLRRGSNEKLLGTSRAFYLFLRWDQRPRKGTAKAGSGSGLLGE